VEEVIEDDNEVEIEEREDFEDDDVG